MVSLQELIADSLAQPKDLIRVHLSMALKSHFADQYVLESDYSLFDPRVYCAEGQAELDNSDRSLSQWTQGYEPEQDQATSELQTGWIWLDWRGHRMLAVKIEVANSYTSEEHWYLVAPNQEVAQQFFLEVCRFNGEVHNEILVFSSGCWQKDQSLHESIKSTELSQLVLSGELKSEIIRDFTTFFASEELFKGYGLPWKRGALFLGPPGNGKTHMIKGLANVLGKPVLYVKSFKHPRDTDHNCIQRVFSKARAMAPCVLVFEDLDSLVDDQNRSFFLNEMDGFASNNGIVTLATANYPEKLDPAILERPSRFDRKYTFELPDEDCRDRFLANFGDRVDERFRLSDSDRSRIVSETTGFSFAYLKELYLSSLMGWVSALEPKPNFVDLMAAQTNTLLSQQANDPGPQAVEDESPMSRYRRSMGF